MTTLRISNALALGFWFAIGASLASLFVGLLVLVVTFVTGIGLAGLGGALGAG